MAVSVIATEHFMYAGLSSTWSVAKFAITQEDKDQVWHYFYEATGASVIFSVITAYMLKSWTPLISSGLTLGYYRKLYADALSRTPTVPTEQVLPGGQLPISNDDNWVPLTDEQLKKLRQSNV